MGCVSSASRSTCPSSGWRQLWKWGYSKWPFQWLDVFKPIELVPSLEIVFEHVRLIATHPLPPMEPAGFGVRNLQLVDLVR